MIENFGTIEDNVNDANEEVKMSLMRNHMALSLLVFLGRSYPDIYNYKKLDF